MTDELRDQIARAARTLKEAGAREVYVFGSAAAGRLREDSDLDMAVSGLPPRNFYNAMGQAAEAVDVALDLVDLDEDNPFIRFLRQRGGLVRVA
jgi:predicted nucleotidyltransferase